MKLFNRSLRYIASENVWEARRDVNNPSSYTIRFYYLRNAIKFLL